MGRAGHAAHDDAPGAWRVDARTFAILLRRRRAVPWPEGTGRVPLTHVATVLANVERLGYTCSPALIDRLLTQTEAELVVFHRVLVHTLRAQLGADKAWTPMYPDIPAQVMAAPEAELYVNALVHYLGAAAGLRLLPAYVEAERPPLADRPPLQVIDLVEPDALAPIARNLIGASTSISPSDRADVEHALRTRPLEQVLPREIPHKETLAFVASVLLTTAEGADAVLTPHFGTATDVLRLAVALSGGDLSLARATRFRSLPRATRRTLLALLERIPAPLEDLYRHREPWLRLAERLHPGESRARFPRTADAFDALRAGRRDAPGFGARLEAAIAAHDVGRALEVARRRPGELARRLDHLARLAAEPWAVHAAFAAVAAEVSTPVLLQVRAHFASRASALPWRAFFPKGDVARVASRPNTLPPLSPALCAGLAEVCRAALVARFRARPPLGRVWVDPTLARYLVPFSQRSASKALRTIVRGSRLPLPDADTLRFFTWWREGKVDGRETGRVDIDLSTVVYREDWSFLTQVSWTNLRSVGFGAAHSGDITSAPDGACEFIDFDLRSVVEAGGRWLVPCLNAFTAQPFCNLPECFVGWMARRRPGSGEVFEPATVLDRVDVAAAARIAVPAVIDARDREVVWADLALREVPTLAVTVEGNARGLAHLARAMTGLRRADLFDLASMHVEARGTPASGPDDADVVFAPHRGITPFDFDRIIAELL
jgi:hypothetical protein